MKRLSKWWLIFYFLIIFSFCLPLITLADNDPGCDPGDPTCPIDGGLTALLAVGAAYGIKKVRDSRKA
ncbi:MAG: hypothetical protein ABI325_11380 [Ginsengibacter sp.]